MDPAKTDAIKEWKPSASLKEVQSFIAFANFYCQFIKDFAVKGQSTFTQNMGGPVFDRGGQGLNR